jgi:hypothetical protein
LSIAGIADPLRAAGLAVTELPGWQDRGESDGDFRPLGIIWHHDGMGLGYDSDPTNDDNVAQFMSQNGNNGAQIWIRRDGNVHLLASGRKWHAGTGAGWNAIPANDGNTYAVGIETDHTFGNPWPDAQVDAIITTSAVLAVQYGWDSANMCGHKEYAPGRKPDPESVDCGSWRARVAARMAELQTHPDPVPPAPEDDLFTDEDRANLAALKADTEKIRSALFTPVQGVVDPATGKPSTAVVAIVAAMYKKVQSLSSAVAALSKKVGG